MTALQRPLRILHLPVNLGGHPAALARAQRALGHDAIAANLAPPSFGFDCDIDFGMPPGSPRRLLVRETGRLRLLWRALTKADVIHAHFGQTLLSLRAFPLRDEARTTAIEPFVAAAAQALWLRDLPLWRRLGKTVAMTFYGDDARLVEGAVQRNPWSHLSLPEFAYSLRARDALKRRLFSALERENAVIFALNPDLLEALPRGARFLPYSHVDLSGKRAARRREGTLKFLHVPSSRAVKGTSFFIESIERMRAAGADCTLTVAENIDNRAVAAMILEHDVLLDQLRVGWYGSVAVEAMARGLPVVAHILPADLQLTPPDFAADLPVIASDPSAIDQVLRRLIALTSDEFAGISARSLAFATKWHDPARTAGAVVEAYGRSASA